MARPIVLIFHRPASADDEPLVRVLAAARERLANAQRTLFERGGGDVHIHSGDAGSFGGLLKQTAPRAGGMVVLGSGGVCRLAARDASQLLEVAASGKRVALTNNRYSSDVCAIGDVTVLNELPALPTDNALPRWLEERAGVSVLELTARERLALDIDSPADIGLWALAPDAPGWARGLAVAENLMPPRADQLRELANDQRRELLVFGRAGSTTLRWLERNVRCRVRFLAEERGLRASSPLAVDGARSRPPRATIGRLLDSRGPQALAQVIADLADGAIIDSRVLIADRFGLPETDWPPPADRFASDLLRSVEIRDPWLRALTESAARSELPIALGAHTLVGPGVRLLLGVARAGR